MNDSILVYSTIPHLCAILPIFYHSRDRECLYSIYCILLVFSTLFSIAWHSQGEPANAIQTLDYTFAYSVFLAELGLSLRCGTTIEIIILNGVTFLINISIDSSDRPNYVRLYSIWNLLSSAKSFYLSNLLSQREAIPV